MEPHQYTYKLPEGYTLNHKHRSLLDILVGRHKMTNEEAQDFVDLHVEMIEEYAKGVAHLIADTLNPKPKAKYQEEGTIKEPNTSSSRKAKYRTKQ